jgi:transcriptional regulator with XRE-family HTH domain
MGRQELEPHERLDLAMTKRSLDVKKRWVQIAKEAGVSTAALGAIRRGEYRPSPHTARGIEDALEWEPGSIDAILAGGQPKPKRTPDESIRSLQKSTQELRATLERLRAEIRRTVDEVVDDEEDPQQLERMRRVIDAFRDAG